LIESLDKKLKISIKWTKFITLLVIYPVVH